MGIDHVPGLQKAFYDWKLNKAHDITSMAFFHELLQKILAGYYDYVHAGPPCSSFSQTRCHELHRLLHVRHLFSQKGLQLFVRAVGAFCVRYCSEVLCSIFHVGPQGGRAFVPRSPWLATSYLPTQDQQEVHIELSGFLQTRSQRITVSGCTCGRMLCVRGQRHTRRQRHVRRQRRVRKQRHARRPRRRPLWNCMLSLLLDASCH